MCFLGEGCGKMYVCSIKPIVHTDREGCGSWDPVSPLLGLLTPIPALQKSCKSVMDFPARGRLFARGGMHWLVTCQ